MGNDLKRFIKKIFFYINKLLRKEFYAFDHFPFDSMQAMNSQNAEKALIETSLWLAKMRVRYRITDGTILGLYRNHAFIPHDNDIDIDILDPENLPTLINSFRTELKYRIGRIAVFNGKIQQIAFYNSDNIIVDLIIWQSKEGVIVNFQEEGYLRSQEAKYFKHIDFFDFNNITYPIPGFIEEWLNFRYGNDWKIPKIYKGDWKEESGDIIKL